MMIKFCYAAVAHTTMFGPHWFPYLLISILKDYKRHYTEERKAEHLFSQNAIMKKTKLYFQRQKTKTTSVLFNEMSSATTKIKRIRPLWNVRMG